MEEGEAPSGVGSEEGEAPRGVGFLRRHEGLVEGRFACGRDLPAARAEQGAGARPAAAACA